MLFFKIVNDKNITVLDYIWIIFPTTQLRESQVSDCLVLFTFEQCYSWLALDKTYTCHPLKVGCLLENQLDNEFSKDRL